MRRRSRGLWLVCAAMTLGASLSTSAASEGSAHATWPPRSPPPIATGAHWGTPVDMATFKRIGYAFDIVTVNPNDRKQWKRALDSARANGLKLIIGGYPAPYSYNARTGAWTITRAGVRLLDYLESRSSLVLALYVYNEPYWISPITGQESPCGGATAKHLRRLRTKIRSVWPSAKIFHDIGHPAGWAPGGYLHDAHPCIGSKYAEATGVADYVGIYDYPFESSGYKRSRGIETLNREANYVVDSMRAIPVWLGQTHACCESLVLPTPEQLRDWNCTIRSLLPPQALISWYVWRQEIYHDYLANHPELWPATTEAACQ